MISNLWEPSRESELNQKLKKLGLTSASVKSLEKSQIQATYKALVARLLFGNGLYQQLTASNDPVLWKAVKIPKIRA
jgi:hypothetical protein